MNSVRDLTADSDAKPDANQLAQLTSYTLTGTKEQYFKILAMISKRMTDYPKIKHVKKALVPISLLQILKSPSNMLRWLLIMDL